MAFCFPWQAPMALSMLPSNLKLLPKTPSSTPTTKRFFMTVRCAPMQQLVQEEADEGIMCEPCNGKGWLLCDFCNGEKTNVKGANNRIYRRCPSCRAIGYNLCSNCKVFKCITFPNYTDGEDLTF